MGWKVPQFSAFIGSEEARAASECVRSNWITEGPRSQEFVERVKEITGVKYGVLAPNGTLALYLALRACEVTGEVLVPDLTFIATATSVVMAGAKPVFVDVDNFGQMSPKAATLALRPETTCCLPVHLYGIACDTSKLPALTCIEDACQGLGVTLRGEPCGSFGLASAFSFFADKTVTTGGEGGFVGTDDEEVYERLRYIRNQGRLDRGSFVHPMIGQNFRMTDIQAAIGLVQLQKMPAIIDCKQAIHALYRKRLNGVVRLLEAPEGSTHIPFRTVAFFERPAAEAAEFLRARGIEPRSAFYPLHRQPCFKGLSTDPRHADERFENTNYFWDHALCLPTFPSITSEQIDLVCDAVKEFCS